MQVKLWAELCEIRYRAENWLRIGWLILKHRPLLRCPFCEGEGGEMGGGEIREWSECHCYRHWNEIDDCGASWAIGRIPFVEWVRFKLSMRWHFEPTRIRDLIRCRIGWHQWRDEPDMEPGLQLCRVCYEHGTVKEDGTIVPAEKI
jgi:hypothetical protein